MLNTQMLPTLQCTGGEDAWFGKAPLKCTLCDKWSHKNCHLKEHRTGHRGENHVRSNLNNFVLLSNMHSRMWFIRLSSVSMIFSHWSHLGVGASWCIFFYHYHFYHFPENCVISLTIWDSSPNQFSIICPRIWMSINISAGRVYLHSFSSTMQF